MHRPESEHGMREGEDFAEIVPERAGFGEVFFDGWEDAGDAALGVGSWDKAVASGEEDEAQDEFGIAFQGLRIAEQQALLTDRDFRS